MASYLEFAWDGNHIEYGSGYDTMTRALRHSALEPFKVEQGLYEKFEADSYLITTRKELESKIKNKASISVPLSDAGVDAGSSFLRNQTITERSSIAVIESQIEYLPSKLKSKAQLFPEARQILDGPDGVNKFLQTYGQYYVSGSKCHSVFRAVMKFSSNEKEELTKFNASVSIDASDVGSATNSFKASLKGYEKHISTSISISFLGYSNKSETTVANTDEIKSTYKAFQRDHTPVPYIALLSHYCTVDARIPPPGKSDKGFHQDLQALQARAVQSRMKRARKLGETISTAYADLAESGDMDADERVVWAQRIKKLKTEMDLWDARQELVQHITRDLKTANPFGQEWIKSGTTWMYSHGIPLTEEVIQFGILHQDVKYEHRNWKTDCNGAFYRNEAYSFGNYPDILIGWRVANNWRNNENGWFKVSKGGDLLATGLDLEFESNKLRGANWGVDVYSVNGALYEMVY